MAKTTKTRVEIDPENLDTYFKRRMFHLGITNNEDHYFKVEVEHPGRPYNQPIFTEAKNGNIIINYPSLHGGPEYIAGTETHFFRQRIHPENQKADDVKYFQEPKSGVHIFHTPNVIEAFANKTKIKTLYAVEGEFKAWSVYMHAGLYIVGLGGKDLFKDKEDDLHEDLKAILRDCEVENFVLLLDADVRALNWNQEDEPLKDLSKRLYSFYNTAIRFRELTKERVKDSYLMHVDDKFLTSAKGIDDLYFVKADDEQRITEDLQRLANCRDYFQGKNLSTTTGTKLKAHFYLNYKKQNLPEDFYFNFQDEIGDAQFKFNNAIYQITKDDGLKLIRHPDTVLYKRVGTNYLKEIKVPNSKKIDRLRRIPWDLATIKMDYISKGFTDFTDHIEKYDAFCNVPNNTDKYEQVINNCYNLYYKLDHEVREGDWSHIRKYLVHAFGETPLPRPSYIKEGEPYKQTTSLDLILDCIQLKYLQPTQRLPIVCLVSRQRATGKSLFLFFMRKLFKENATIIGNSEINDQYNDDWAPKAFIGIDEGFIDKKTVLEKVKSQSTNDEIKLRGMYAGRQDVSFFGWFVFTSNDEDNFISIDGEEIRFWVVKVKPFVEEDSHLLEKMEKEIPAFLHYLQNRELVHDDRSRFWFDRNLLETEALRKVKEKSKGWFAAELKEIMTEQFFKFQYPTLYFSLREIFEMVNTPNSGTRWRQGDIKNQLEEKFGLKAKNNRYQHPLDPSVPGNARTQEKKGRMYEFRIEEFLTESEIREELGDYIDFDKIAGKRKNAAAGLPDEDEQGNEPF